MVLPAHFWVKVMIMPTSYRDFINGVKRWMDCDPISFPTKALHKRVLIDISKPIRRGITVDFKSISVRNGSISTVSQFLTTKDTDAGHSVTPILIASDAGEFIPNTVNTMQGTNSVRYETSKLNMSNSLREDVTLSLMEVGYGFSSNLSVNAVSSLPLVLSLDVVDSSQAMNMFVPHARVQSTTFSLNAKGKAILGEKRFAFSSHSMLVGDFVRKMLKRACANSVAVVSSSDVTTSSEQAGVVEQPRLKK
uniref:Uncharacterized protein n=1 Tax=Cannabis sativa TaxID=3483 RepID=A0A803PKV0_CANSA